jgi:hypothetical protein
MIDLELFSPLIYIPKIEQQSIYIKDGADLFETNLINEDLLALSKGENSLNYLIEKVDYNIKPVTDNNPFFFNNERGIPRNILPLLIMALVVNLFIVLIGLIFGRKNKKIFDLFVLFILLGFGFMIIEISLFQKLISYIGSPIVSLSITLSSILVGMGLGSMFGNRIFRGNHKIRLVIFGVVIFCLAIGIFYGISFMFNNLVKYSLFIKSLISAFMLIPIGFALGVPFPSGLAIAKERNLIRSIPLLYGVNATMSILGSVSAIAISTVYGFSLSIIIGALCYLIFSIIFLIRKT